MANDNVQLAMMLQNIIKKDKYVLFHRWYQEETYAGTQDRLTGYEQAFQKEQSACDSLYASLQTSFYLEEKGYNAMLLSLNTTDTCYYYNR